MKKELTKKELNELVGGNTINSNLDDQFQIRNINGYDGCVCTYNNSSSTLSNENSVKGCACKCI